MRFTTVAVIIGAICICSGAQTNFSQSSPSAVSSPNLTNDDIVALVNAGLSPDIIAAKIQTSASTFDTSPAALTVLKSRGVPEDVILAMVKSPGKAIHETATERVGGVLQNSTLVIYRPKRFFGSALKPSVYVDGKEIGRLVNGRYFSIEVAAGSHKIESSMKKRPAVPVDAKPGSTNYVEMEILAGNWRGGGELVPAEESGAKDAMKSLKPLDAKWLFDSGTSEQRR